MDAAMFYEMEKSSTDSPNVELATVEEISATEEKSSGECNTEEVKELIEYEDQNSLTKYQHLMSSVTGPINELLVNKDAPVASFASKTVPEATVTSETQLNQNEPPVETIREPSPPKIVSSVPPESKKEESPPNAPSTVITYCRQKRLASRGVQKTIAAVLSRSAQKKRELETVPEATVTSETQLNQNEQPVETIREPSPPKMVSSVPPEAKQDESAPNAPSSVRNYCRQKRLASRGVKKTVEAVMSRRRSAQKKTEPEVRILKPSEYREKAEKILGATQITGEVHYLVKWEGGIEASILPSKFVASHYPQQLIPFLQERLEWIAPSGEE